MSPELPKVSFCIATYQQRDLIEETMKSVLAQDYPHLEIFVADDGSTDGTREIVREFASKHPQIQAILSTENRGITANVNAMIERVSGEFIAIMGGDDLAAPHRVRRQVEALHTHPTYSACVSSSLSFVTDPSVPLATRNPAKELGRSYATVEDVIESCNSIGVGSAWLWRRSMTPTKLEPQIPMASDALFNIETALQGPVLLIDDVLTYYRVSAHSATSRGLGADPFVTAALLEHRYPHLIASIRQFKSKIFLHRGIDMLRRGEHREARLQFKECLRLDTSNYLAFPGWGLSWAPKDIVRRVLKSAARERGRV